MDKHCPACDTTKPITEYYKAAGNCYQKRCKPCHNKNRNNYKTSYTHKKAGFKKLPEETQKGIIEDLKNKLSKKAVAEKYKMKYQTISRWCRLGKIPLE